MRADTPCLQRSSLWHLSDLAPFSGEVEAETVAGTGRVSLFPCCSRWGLVRGRRVHNFRAGNEVVCDMHWAYKLRLEI